MITFTEILEIFQEYLQSASCVEVLPTKWGYVRLYYEEPYCDSFEAVLCRTPEELFEVLLLPNHKSIKSLKKSPRRSAAPTANCTTPALWQRRPKSLSTKRGRSWRSTLK